MVGHFNLIRTSQILVLDLMLQTSPSAMHQIAEIPVRDTTPQQRALSEMSSSSGFRPLTFVLLAILGLGNSLNSSCSGGYPPEFSKSCLRLPTSMHSKKTNFYIHLAMGVEEFRLVSAYREIWFLNSQIRISSLPRIPAIYDLKPHRLPEPTRL